MKYIIRESQYNNLSKLLLSENKSGIVGCRVFDDKNLKEFCVACEKLISSELSEYRPKMENLLKKYFTSDEKIVNVEMEKLTEESPIVVKGFNEIDEVCKLINSNCPESKDISEKLKKGWISKYNVYFKDHNGQYHLLNRLDTNYTAMAILITTYYTNLINQVREWTTKKTTPSSLFVKDWTDHFFNTSTPLIDPRKNLDKNVLGISKDLEKLADPVSIFNKVLKPNEFEIEDSDFHTNFMKALKEVRDKGFKTEDIFENLLKKNKIVYKRYSGDFSFVDMVLGIDFLIKQNRKGQDYWVPVQVKSSFEAKYNLIDKLRCTKVIKPELTKIKGTDDFTIGDIKGFEEYFCEEHKYCQTSEKTKPKFVPSNIDYLSSREFLEK